MKKLKFLKTNNIAVRLGLGIFFGFLTTMATMLIFAAVIVNYDIPIETHKYFWFVISAISGFMSAIICCQYVKSHSLLWGSLASLISGIIVFLILIVGCMFDFNILLLAVIPASLISGAIGSIITVNLR